VASLSQGRTAAAQCGLFTHKSVPVIFEPPCTSLLLCRHLQLSHRSYKQSNLTQICRVLQRKKKTNDVFIRHVRKLAVSNLHRTLKPTSVLS